VKSATPRFRSCTFADNTASSHGGAVYSYFYGASVVLDHCIIARSGQGEAVYCYYDGAATLVCCDVFGNAGGDWVGCIADQEDVNGNLWVDPMFCNPYSADYRLASGSPCASGNTPGGCEQMGALGIGCTYTSVAESQAIVPTALALGTAVPNPFNPLTEITYAIPASEKPSRVVLNVYDARGRRVTTLVDAFLCAGVYRIAWDARDHRGVEVASGVYFYRISWNGKNETARMVLLR